MLYASVGQAGATGYLAAMGLVGIAPAAMKPAALLLNVVAGSIGATRYAAAGHLSLKLVVPLLAGSLPLALVGGYLDLPAHIYLPLVGGLLVLSSAALAARVAGWGWLPAEAAPPRGWVLAGVGAAIGLLAGATGNGGGVFLAPLLLLTGWADARATAATTILFVLVNSAGALAAHMLGTGEPAARLALLPPGMLAYSVSAALGAAIGAGLGARRLPTRVMQGLLAAVLLVAGAQMLM